MDFKVVFEKQKAGGYTVYVPELPGCVSQGETRAEAMRNIREAIDLYIEDLTAEELESLRENISITTAKVSLRA